MEDRVLTDNLIGNGGNEELADIKSEKALLSLCLKNPTVLDNVIGKRLYKEDFSNERHRIIFDAIAKLYEENKTVDPYIVVKKLQSDGKLSRAGGNEYVMSLTDTYAVSSSAMEYLDIIRDFSSRRKILKALNRLTTMTVQGKSSASDIADTGINELTDLRESSEGEGFEPLKDILKETFINIYNVSIGKVNRNVVRTGFTLLDSKLGGLRPGTLNILAARPGMGKTALALNIAVNAASLQGSNVDIFSLEMSKTEICNRLIASTADTTARELQYASIDQSRQLEIYKSCRSLTDLPIYIDDSSAVNPSSMISACKKLKAQNRLGLVIVDYLQLMETSDKSPNKSRQAEVTEISRSLKILAKEMDVPILALSQLNRGTENREDHTPQLSDLRDSGAIEQDADSVFFIDRDNYRDDRDTEAPDEQNARIIIAKNRHGGTGQVFLKWHASKTLFTNYPSDKEPKEPVGFTPPKKDSQTLSASYTYTEEERTEQVPSSAPDEDFLGEPEVLDNPSNDEMFNDANTSIDFPEDLF